MLALKKKREAEAAAVKAAAAVEPKQEPGDAAGPQKVSLFGIGGEKKTKNGDSKTGKKRTPGEIRIQKGKLLILSWLLRCAVARRNKKGLRSVAS
jgi:hypothetical protein